MKEITAILYIRWLTSDTFTQFTPHLSQIHTTLFSQIHNTLLFKRSVVCIWEKVCMV